MENFRDNFWRFKKAPYYIVINGFSQNDEVEPLPLGNAKIKMVYAWSFYGERSIRLLAEPLAKLFNDSAISTDSFCAYMFGKIENEDLEVIKNYGQMRSSYTKRMISGIFWTIIHQLPG